MNTEELINEIVADTEKQEADIHQGASMRENKIA